MAGEFGYEGEGFDIEPREPEQDFSRRAERGWNIGRADDRPSNDDETPIIPSSD